MVINGACNSLKSGFARSPALAHSPASFMRSISTEPMVRLPEL
jgi:hypothetical protein